jgi:hypothetical protein
MEFGTDMNKLAPTVIAVVLAAAVAIADDAWVVQGFATTDVSACKTYRWRGDLLFHNAAGTAAAVQLLGVSNGVPQSPDRVITIPAGRSTSLSVEGKNWAPAPQPPIWVTHVDIPPSVTLESRILIGLATCTGLPPGDSNLGKLSFPVYRTLQPANVTKYYVGTDLGETIQARNNVLVYNAGASSAHFRVEVRQICDDAVLDSRDLDVAADTALQLNGLNTRPAGCSNPAYAYQTYVAVTATQPSLSWVSAISNVDDIKVVYAANSSSP